jgi:CheY-like chemotaxis protein
MSLVGNLEDLGLGEILQIVSLSRKSGILALHSRGREGRVIFRNGMVTQAHSTVFNESLGEVLVRKGIIDLATMRKALTVQASEEPAERLGSILTRRFDVSADAIEEVVRDQIERVVYSLFAWAEGTFDFELQDTVEAVDNAGMDPRQFMLDQGLNPQYLAMEGSRIVDERRHRGEELDEGAGAAEAAASDDNNIDFAFDLLQEPPQEAPAPFPESPPPMAEPVPAPVPIQEPIPAMHAFAGRAAVVVDDDRATVDGLTALLSAAGYDVHPFEKGEEALIAVDSLYRSGTAPTVIIDLLMPRMDGTGMLGGVELLELVHNNFSGLPVLVLSDYSNSDAERQIREMGYSLAPKPRKGEMESLAVRREFAAALLPLLERVESGGKPASPAGESINIGDELRLELGEDIDPAQSRHVQASTGIALLRGMLEELNNPSLGGGIILLVLRFASEFMNRAVIFIVKKDEVAGLGQFGISDREGNADSRIRNMRIPREEPSLFTRVIDAQMPTKLQPDDSKWNLYLLEQLRGGVPREVFVGPIVSEGKVVAVLYGDNLPENRAIGDTESLEIFLSQAGLAMEKALLQRRLKDRGQGE